MKNQFSAFERRLEILHILSKQKKSSFEELSVLYDVTRRTIYNDIVFLSRYAPIYTKNGKGGGVFIIEDNNAENKNLYLMPDEEKLLKKLIHKTDGKDVLLLKKIINRYSPPRVGT